jgi:hypothetical protein
MKKFAIMIAFIAINMLSYAQIENIPVSADSSVTVDKLYAGMLSGTMFSVDSLHTDKFVNMHVGIAATWKMNNYISIKAMETFHWDINSQFGLTHFFVKITPSKLFTLQFGQTSTLITEQRPHPATGAGQFETFSEAQIPGAAPNIKMNINPSSDISFGIGAAIREKKPEYHANIKFKKLVISGYYGIHDEKAGAAASWYGKKVYDTFVWKQDQIVSNIFCLNIFPKINLTLYADLGYDLKNEELVRCEGGILKNFESKYIKGLYGIGYQDEINTVHKTKTVNLYFWIHL